MPLSRARVAAGLLGLLVVSYLLRSTAIHGRYWIDEGLSVGIASFPLDEIPGALRQDGSPPLYYLLLHVWIDVIGGNGEARTHALSLGFALLAIPVAYALARQLFSERAGWCRALAHAHDVGGALRPARRTDVDRAWLIPVDAVGADRVVQQPALLL